MHVTLQTVDCLADCKLSFHILLLSIYGYMIAQVYYHFKFIISSSNVEEAEMLQLHDARSTVSIFRINPPLWCTVTIKNTCNVFS